MATDSSPRSCRSPEAQRRFSVHGSTNVNYRSLEDDNDFELNISVDDEGLAESNPAVAVASCRGEVRR